MRSWPAPTVPTLPAAPAQPLRLFDSAAGAPVVVPGIDRPDPDTPATLYVCGITPYDATHLGHAATYLAFDLVQRYWLAQGRTVRYVQNVTDVDDPLLERAERDGVPWEQLATSQIDLFRSDMTALRLLPPEHYVAVTDETADIAAAVGRLLDSGAAYRVADDEYPDVYFDVSATGRFGYESRMDTATMLALSAERGGDPDRPGKKNPLDPLLWRLARPGEPRWPAEIGAGRPGWHIECSVIAQKYLAPSVDVQGGGSDLLFPHHESSAAHAEALAGIDRFAGAYVHAGMLGYRGEKMSKSLGNLVFVSKLVAGGVDPMAIRLALLADHYRADREWTDAQLDTAAARLRRWREAAARSGAAADGVVTDLAAAIADDLDTPKALAVLDDWAADPSSDGPSVAVAVDALLGVELSGSH
ncbi:cysteine--1-D-myo-inosityl 2-amino-2-deoxy-alpha-D-glucopyranoside ligase [Nakamurella aerolata]|uniref:L-cysteine:1D-myo-inositol 2-amino-2-deoxy-alpha-D-glucopyranoside ligase n=1 Tax=Nakamurella aerolata TaxID=1656892 RepID=A0A849A1C2_9ACTN|nr:cysteine--1-D-myo-inosityl 2-amino-2-deoxy-alpha-D-glucopyranoside ligase [Nakamurella aerolata]